MAAKRLTATVSPELAGAISLQHDGLRLTIKAKPGISRKRRPGFVDIGRDKRALEMTVAAVAEDGKANQAILDQLAELLDVRKSSLLLKTGSTGRIKIIEITGDPAALQSKLIQFL